MSETAADSSFNQCLAQACIAANVSCCRRGRIFLPPEELAAIRGWLAGRSEAERARFEKCVDEAHEGFALFDQENGCQFLDDRGLCRLHNEGVKPTECFWWPLHVYVNDREQLEIRISESCCGAHRCLDQGTTVTQEKELAKIDAKAREIGLDVIRAFRSAYAGSYTSRPVRTIAE